jgi:hypothetical protein
MKVYAMQRFSESAFGGTPIFRRFHRSLLMLLCLWLLLAFHPSTAQETKTPRFGEGIVILQIPGRFLTNLIVSPDGDYVFVTGNLINQQMREQGYAMSWSMISARQYIWRIYDSSFGNGLIYQRPNWEFTIDETIMEPAAAFSPDGRYLATRSGTRMQLFAAPDWLEVDSVTLTTFFDNPDIDGGRLRWSPDSDLLAAFDSTGIVVWDTKENAIKHHPLPVGHEWDRIVPVATGWIVEFPVPITPTNFASCDWLLETCAEYTFLDDNLFPQVVSEDGVYVLTADSKIEGLGVWQRQANGQYELEMRDTPPDFQRPFSFDPTGRYLLSAQEPQPWLSWAIWDFATFAEVSKIPPRIHEPIWLPDGEHLIAFERWPELVVKLYQVGKDTPLQEVNLTNFSEIKRFADKIIFDSVSFHLSENGEKLVINLNWAALVIPIEYE